MSTVNTELFEYADSEVCLSPCALRVDGNLSVKPEEKVTFSNETGYVWTGPN